MLYLLNSPAWAAPDQTPRPLPLTLPAALLVVLATEAGWVARERLALVFWPEAAPSDALHHLRINLHRARGLLEGWGAADALQAERTRVRLTLPSDLDPLRQARASGDAKLLSRLSPEQWLQGWRLPGNEGFAQWCDETAQRLQADWLAGSRRQSPPVPGPAARAAHAATAEADTAPPGRRAELRQLLDCGTPALLLLGEPGAGKTTLLRAAWPQAACVRGLEGLHGMPYRPLLDVLRERAATLERALREPAHPLRPYRLDLARVLPELAPDEALPPLDAVTARSRLVEALARAFEALSPLLLVDDLQWCDDATVEWLLMLAQSGRLHWRAAARTHELPAAIQQALQPLRHAGRLQELTLAPLDAAALAQVCASRQPGRPLSADGLARLHALSGGNALLAVELLDAQDEAEPSTDASPAADASVPAGVARLVLGRMQRLPPLVRHAVEAAAVFVQPVPAAALRQLTGLPAPARRAGDRAAASPDGSRDERRDDPRDDNTSEHSEAGDAAWAAVCAQACAAGLLRQDGDRLDCRHDLIRQAITQALPPARRLVLHRHAALWLATQTGADALTIAEHWLAAGEPQTALAWQHQGAEQLKARGRFEQARALWHTVADESLDATQALRARLELAACDLFEDLARGDAALKAVIAQLAAVADPEQHRHIEGRALSALVDNRVFAGDIAAARTHAARLRVLLPDLATAERVDALEVLIELAMREPDIPAAWSLLAHLRALAPRRPSLLSWEGQIHWFGGQAQAAHDALARLLERHPEYCRGLTIENDLAVMLQALGQLDEAEAMVRRSLDSWRGVPHTEALSLLVLGSIHTSAGRHGAARQALQQSLVLARAQASAAFEAEALIRLARSLLREADPAGVLSAEAVLGEAAPLLATGAEPMRVSQFVLLRVLLALRQAGAPADLSTALAADLQRLDDAVARSPHPLVHTRACRVRGELALAAGDAVAAEAAALRQAELAAEAGLPEPRVEAWLLLLRARQAQGAEAAAQWALARQAEDLARRHGLVDLAADAAEAVARLGAP